MSVTIHEQIAKGMGRNLTIGAFSTGLAGGGALLVIDIDRPLMVVGVPAGVCIRPFSIYAQCQPGISTADDDEAEILIAVDSLGLYTGADNDHTIEIPSNLRTDLDKGSACRCGSVWTGDMETTPGYAVAVGADPVLDLELDRKVMATNFGDATFYSEVQMNLKYEPKEAPYLIGPCSLIVYMGGTIDIVGGFVQANWVEGSLAQMIPAI